MYFTLITALAVAGVLVTPISGTRFDEISKVYNCGRKEHTILQALNETTYPSCRRLNFWAIENRGSVKNETAKQLNFTSARHLRGKLIHKFILQLTSILLGSSEGLGRNFRLKSVPLYNTTYVINGARLYCRSEYLYNERLFKDLRSTNCMVPMLIIKFGPEPYGWAVNHYKFAKKYHQLILDTGIAECIELSTLVQEMYHQHFNSFCGTVNDHPDRFTNCDVTGPCGLGI